MPVHDLPGPVFRSKDHRSPQSVWGDILPSTNLGLCPLYLYNIGKLRSHLLRYDLYGNHLTIPAERCGMPQDLSNLLPSTPGRPVGASSDYVFSMGQQLPGRLGVTKLAFRKRSSTNKTSSA